MTHSEVTHSEVTHSELITRMSHSFKIDCEIEKCVRGTLSEVHASDFDNNYQNQTHGPILLMNSI